MMKTAIHCNGIHVTVALSCLLLLGLFPMMLLADSTLVEHQDVASADFMPPKPGRALAKGKKKVKAKKTSAPVNCETPLMLGFGAEDRAILERCASPIVVSAYHSYLHFARSILEITTNSRKDWNALLKEGFEFVMDLEYGYRSKCERDEYRAVCQLLECKSRLPADLGDLATETMAFPDHAPLDVFNALLSDCETAYRGNCLRDLATGGSGSGSGTVVYCTDTSQNTSEYLFETGGGGGAGASLGVTTGGGGGGGFNIFAQGLDQDLDTTCGGGCGTQYNGDGTSCEPQPKPCKSGKKSKKSIKKERFMDEEGDSSSSLNAGFPCADEGQYEGCDTPYYQASVAFAKAKVAECLANPGREISISGGGGGGGGIIEQKSQTKIYEFSSGFGFNVGPKPFIIDPGDPGNSNSTNGTNPIVYECMYAYSKELCDNAGYTDLSTIWALCQCPVEQLYNPTGRAFNCTYPGQNITGVVITEPMIEQNCGTWCPASMNSSTSGMPCPELEVCANCMS